MKSFYFHSVLTNISKSFRIGKGGLYKKPSAPYKYLGGLELGVDSDIVKFGAAGTLEFDDGNIYVFVEEKDNISAGLTKADNPPDFVLHNYFGFLESTTTAFIHKVPDLHTDFAETIKKSLPAHVQQPLGVIVSRLDQTDTRARAREEFRHHPYLKYLYIDGSIDQLKERCIDMFYSEAHDRYVKLHRGIGSSIETLQLGQQVQSLKNAVRNITVALGNASKVLPRTYDVGLLPNDSNSHAAKIGIQVELIQKSLDNIPDSMVFSNDSLSKERQNINIVLRGVKKYIDSVKDKTDALEICDFDVKDEVWWI